MTGSRRPLRSAIFLLAGLLGYSSAHATNWLQFGFDQQHSGYNSEEKGFSTAGNVKLFEVSIPASEAQPALLTDVVTRTRPKDLLFVVLFDGTLAAFNAANGAVVWSRKTTGNGQGVESGAAIDPNLQFVYATGQDGKVHKYAVADGTETIDAHWPEISSLKPVWDNPSAALSIATDSTNTPYLYSATSGYRDVGDTQGHVTAINLQTGTQNVFNTQCSDLMMHFVDAGTPRVNDCNLHGTEEGDGQMSGIWGRPGVVYDAQTDRIYFTTGNALFDANTANGHEWGDSVLALHADGTGSGMGWPVDSYTPLQYASLYYNDVDLGSASPTILPSSSAKYPHVALQVSKDSCLRLINLDDMSGAGGPGNVGGEVAPLSPSCGSISYQSTYVQPAVWVDPQDGATWVFVPTFGNLIAYRLFVNSAGDLLLAQQWTLTEPSQNSPVVANGTVYYQGASRDQQGHTIACLKAVDARTGVLVWQSESIQGVHRQSPIVANGRIYLVDGHHYSATHSLVVYALDGIFRDSFQ